MRTAEGPRRFAGKTGESAEGCGDMRRDGGDGDFMGFGGCAVGASAQGAEAMRVRS